MKELALTSAQEDFVTRSRQAAEDILKGRSDRLLVVVGPCSIHDATSALEYATRLKAVREKHAADLEICRRYAGVTAILSVVALRSFRWEPSI